MPELRIAVQIPNAHTPYAQMRNAWTEVEALGVDVLYNWDHFFPLSGDPDGLHLEAWTLLGAMAEATERIRIGTLVVCNSYRNPHLHADMARTIDHISGGRMILGLGAGWFERDYTEYGYDFKTAPDRLRDLRDSLPVIKERLGKLNPGPVNGHIPILIGGSGEKVTLRLVAQYADVWHGFGDPETVKRRYGILEEWCAKVGRNPAEIDRSHSVRKETLDLADAYADNGASEIVFQLAGPNYDYGPVKELIAWRDKRRAQG
jgi:probable F420-dependent oxidoreductase